MSNKQSLGSAARNSNTERIWKRRSLLIAQIIIEELRVRGMLQKELAEMIGMKPQQLCRILAGNVNMTLRTISSVEVALDIHIIVAPCVSTSSRKKLSR